MEIVFDLAEKLLSKFISPSCKRVVCGFRRFYNGIAIRSNIFS
jgi:hypothetical protein